MPQSLARNILHLVFSTKHRAPLITDEVRPDLHAYMAGILTACDSPAIIINSVADHAHVLFVLARTWALCDVIEELKKSSSKWAKANGLSADFYWQNGYGSFSVSPSNVEVVGDYIERQAEHHASIDFQDEYRAFLRRHGIVFDERYVWD